MFLKFDVYPTELDATALYRSGQQTSVCRKNSGAMRVVFNQWHFEFRGRAPPPGLEPGSPPAPPPLDPRGPNVPDGAAGRLVRR